MRHAKKEENATHSQEEKAINRSRPTENPDARISKHSKIIIINMSKLLQVKMDTVGEKV